MAKAYNQRSIPEGKKSVTFNIDLAQLERVKDLAFKEGVTDSDIYNAAVKKFIELYEKKNGKIKPRPPKGKGLEQL